MITIRSILEALIGVVLLISAPIFILIITDKETNMASKHYHIKFNFDHDKEIIDRIESKENKNDYIRGLVLSDIAADVLRDSIKLEDPDENEYNDRVDFYNEHCPALNNLDSSKYHCVDCKYTMHYTDVDGIKKTACCLEDEWRKHWTHVHSNASNALKSELNVEEDRSDESR